MSSVAADDILSPLQSASKYGWVLENVPGARARADAGRLRFGTIDTVAHVATVGGSVVCH